MKHLKLTILAVTLFLITHTFHSCKSKEKPATVSDTAVSMQPTDTGTMQPAQVQVSPDDSLTSMAKDAVKDYPNVTATVNNGEVTLTGNITREKLPKLMMAVSAMHPKKINNNLTIK